MLQKNQFFLRFLNLRVVVNGHLIYSLVKNRPVVIRMPTNPSRLVLTDGFHISAPIELTYSAKKTSFFRVACIIEDDQLLVGFIITALLYAIGFVAGMVLLEFLSTGPIFYFLFQYYINRKDFIQLQPA